MCLLDSGACGRLRGRDNTEPNVATFFLSAERGIFDESELKILAKKYKAPKRSADEFTGLYGSLLSVLEALWATECD